MRNYSIDTIKFFAAYAVVVIHTQPFKNFEGDLYEKLYFIIRTLSSFAVPFFFASTGYLFYKKISKIDNKLIYVVSYLKRICKILFITMIIYILYNLIKLLLSSNPTVNIKIFLKSIVKIENIYYGIDSGGMFHLWYLLVPIYIIPILYIFRNKIRLLTLIFGLFNIIGILIQVYGININVRDSLFYGGFYISMGCCIFIYEEYIKNKICNVNLRYLLYIFIIINILQLCEAKLIGRMTYSFSTIFITFTIFIIIIKNNYILQDNIINKIGSESIGIYLIHPIIIDIIYLVINKMNISSIANSNVWQILFTPIVFITSYVIYKIFKHFNYKIYSVKNLIVNQ